MRKIFYIMKTPIGKLHCERVTWLISEQGVRGTRAGMDDPLKIYRSERRFVGECSFASQGQNKRPCEETAKATPGPIGWAKHPAVSDRRVSYLLWDVPPSAAGPAKIMLSQVQF